MKFPSFPSWIISLLLLGAVTLTGAEPATLASTPAVTDLNQPAKAGVDPASGNQAQLAELKLTAQFDRNGDHQLDAKERQAARLWLAQHPPADPVAVSGRPGPPPQVEAPLEPMKPGEKVARAEAATYAERPLYEPKVLRTVFLEFADADWEKELAEFARTDVLVPAKLIFDGISYPGVGARFHNRAAATAFAAGYKQSLDLKLDYTVAGQAIGPQRELRLLDARTDPTLLRTMLYHRVAQEYGPAPQANFVRVVINGEDWGVYVSVQPFDENFIAGYFKTTEGARWTALPGGNLAYLGDDPEAYRRYYRLESAEDPAAWVALAQLCKLLEKTPGGQIKDALEPHLELDSVLMFLALQNTLINQDGYGSSHGSYGLYLDPQGRFHLIPQDAATSFRLLQATDYVERRTERPKVTGGKEPKSPEAHDDAPKGYDRNDFPRQSGTDLAMLLSYSFLNKADTNLDGKVTKDEWLSFARAWFLVMDEDYAGELTRKQFIDKVRAIITPTSISDGRSRQTFGKDDPAGMIAQDFFNAMDDNHDNRLTQEELTGTFGRWFAAWSDPKTGWLTQERIQRGFKKLFSQSVFQADQSFIAKRNELSPAEAAEHEGGRHGGSGARVGPLSLLGIGGKGDGNSRSLLTFHVELDPLGELDDATKPLLTKLLAVPALRARYLDFIKDIAENWLTWAKLGPIAKESHELITAEVAKETHKPASYERFVQELDQDTTQGARDGDEAPSLRNFITERSKYLLKDDQLSSGN